MACNWLMMTSFAEHHPQRLGYSHLENLKKNKPKAEQETVQPTAARFTKTFKKRKNRALFTLRRSQKHYEILSNNVLRRNITRKQLRLETIEIA